MHKLVILGDTATGKTTLFHAITDSSGAQSLTHAKYPTPTLQPDFKISSVSCTGSGRTETFKVFDTMGAERYSPAIPTTVYRNAHVVFLLYDVTSVDTLVSLCEWKKRTEEHNSGGTNILFVVVGNKVDLLPQYGSKEEPISLATVAAEEFSTRQRCRHFVISAATHYGVFELMETISEEASRIHTGDGNNSVYGSQVVNLRGRGAAPGTGLRPNCHCV